VSLVDQSGSLGVVGDVFEVMAQVDRCLTEVDSVDPIIRVNDWDENLGRHKDALSFPPFQEHMHLRHF
jgi:hypothetical protein